MSPSIPSQHQPPGLDSILRVAISQGPEFDVLRHLIIRKDHLYAIVKFLDNRCKDLGGVEFRTPQLLWLRVE